MIRFALLSTLLLTGVVNGKLLAADPISTDMKFLWGVVKGNLTKSAQKVPDELYNFKPTPDVRSFGQLVGHVTDAMTTFCTAAAGAPKRTSIEKEKSTKADLVAALQQATTTCDAVYNKVNDAAGAETVKFFGADRSVLGVLSFNNQHLYEHYGNMVTYMRLKGIVPPSSEK